MSSLNILTLLNTKGIGRREVETLLNGEHKVRLEEKLSMRELSEILTLSREELPIVSELCVNKLMEGYGEASRIIESAKKSGVSIISMYDSAYPKAFYNVSGAPLILYVKGNKKALNNKNMAAVIGTRNPTPHGLKEARRIAGILAENKFTVVSGLALGCDTAAHAGALKKDGTTIAVLPGGINNIYPPENEMLAGEIIEKNGALVAEYPPDDMPKASRFIERDRLQSALSKGIIVIETDLDGGTMHTARFAKEYKRLIACLKNHPEEYLKHPQLNGNEKLLAGGAFAIAAKNDIEKFIKRLKTV
jgi:DNA processing protein